jgi:translation initiation factor IF-1
MAQVVEHLPSKQKDLNSNPSIVKKKKKKKIRIEAGDAVQW